MIQSPTKVVNDRQFIVGGRLRSQHWLYLSTTVVSTQQNMKMDMILVCKFREIVKGRFGGLMCIIVFPTVNSLSRNFILEAALEILGDITKLSGKSHR